MAVRSFRRFTIQMTPRDLSLQLGCGPPIRFQIVGKLLETQVQNTKNPYAIPTTCLDDDNHNEDEQ